MIFFFFGYPGIGKDYLAEKLSQLVNIPHIDADDFLTKKDKQKLINGTFNKADRLRKLAGIVKYIKKLKAPNIAAADSLPDNDSRQFLIDQFGKDIIFIYVYSSKSTHLKRLKKRKDHFFTKNLLDDYIKKHWEEIEIPHIKLLNEEIENAQIDKKLLHISHKVSTL